ncbi:MAG: protein kinase [Candidatus Eisenbacteria bacterium]
MTTDRTAKTEALFHGALELDPAARPSFLEQACAGDVVLRAEVESLLDARSRAGVLFERSAAQHLGPAPSDVGRRIGPYLLTEHLASGGMGSVYIGIRDDQELRARVAIKLIRPGLGGPDVLQRFRRERQILADLQHPNIARLLDGGSTPDGSPYIVMEYVDGVPIDRYCNEDRLSVRRRVELFLDVCDAVQHAHRFLVVHRDLKPSNILVDGSGHAKLLDFGIAKVLEETSDLEGPEATVTAFRRLTPRYASPEQVLGLPTSTLSDVYSLGVILYELLTGESPYRVETRSLTKIERSIEAGTIPRPSRSISAEDLERSALRGTSPRGLARALQGDLDTILLRALAREPERRYASAGHLAQDLRNHLAGWPVAARPDTTLYRLRKFAHRNRALTVVTSCAFAALAGALALTWSAYQRAATERQQAEWSAYRGAIAAAESELLLDKTAEARLRLEVVPLRQRGWEWRHLYARLDRSRFHWLAHRSGITDLCLSPDGEFFATSSLDSMVKLWRTDDRTLIQSWGPFDFTVESVAIDAKSGQLFAGMNDGTVVVLTRDAPVVELLHGDGPNREKSWPAIAIRSDGTEIAVGFLDGWVHVWDIQSREAVAAWRAVTSFAQPEYSPDGRWLYTAGIKGEIERWSGSSHRWEGQVQPPGVQGRILAVTSSTNGAFLATASMDHTINVRDLRSGELLTTFRGHDASVNAMVFSPTAEFAVSSGADDRLLRWRVADGKLVGTYRGHTSDVSALGWSRDGTWLVSGDWRGFLRIWDPWVEDVRAFRVGGFGRVPSVLDAAYDPGRQRVVCACEDEKVGCIRLDGDGSDLSFCARVQTTCVELSRDGSLAVVGTETGKLLALEVERFARDREAPPLLREETGAPVTASIAAHLGPVRALARVADEDLFVSAGKDSIVRLWRLPDLGPVGEWRCENEECVSLAISPERKRLAVGFSSGAIQVRDLLDGRLLSECRGHHAPVGALAWSRDGSELASASIDGSARVWSARTGRVRVVLIEAPPRFNAIAWSEDGTRIALGGSDQVVRLFDGRSGQPVNDLHGHVGAVRHLEFVDNDQRLVSASYDGTIRVWDAPAAP